MFLPGSAGIGQDFLFSILFSFHHTQNMRREKGSSVAEPHRHSAGLKAILNCGPALTPFTFLSFSAKGIEGQQNPVHRLQPFQVQDKVLGGLVCDFILGWTQTWKWKSPLRGAHLMCKRNRTGMKKLAGTEEGEHIEKLWRDWDYKQEVEVSRREESKNWVMEILNCTRKLWTGGEREGWGSSKARWEQSGMEAGYRPRDWRICSH